MPRVYEGDRPYIFVCYEHADDAAVQPIIASLMSEGYRVWYDDGIQAGSSVSALIADHLHDCSCVLALISSSWIASEKRRDEVVYALDLKKPVLPVYLEDVELPRDLQMRLGDVKALHWHAYANKEEFNAKLVCEQVLLPCLTDDGRRRRGVKPSINASSSDKNAFNRSGGSHLRDNQMICVGYGKRKGVCRESALGKGIRYCPICYISQLSKQLASLVVSQGYIIKHERTNPSLGMATIVAVKNNDLLPHLVTLFMCSTSIHPFDFDCLSECRLYMETIEKAGHNSDAMVVFDSFGGYPKSSIMAAIREAGYSVASLSSLERRSVNFKPYESYVKQYYTDNKLSRHIELNVKTSNELLVDKVHSYLNDTDDERDARQSLLILGDFGVGKTSFCYKLAYELLEGIESSDGASQSYFPIVILLGDLKRSGSIAALITNYFTNKLRIENFTINLFQRYLEYNRVLLIFDGFDEISTRLTPDFQLDIFDEICSYATGQTKIIITCRPNIFRSRDDLERMYRSLSPISHYESNGDAPNIKFRELTIAELNDDQVRLYISRQREKLKDYGLNENTFMDIMATIHDLRDLARRPVLLDIILKTLPDLLAKQSMTTSNSNTSINAAKLYDFYTSEWIGREIRKGRVLLNEKIKREFCTHLAVKMLVDGLSSIQIEDVVQEIQKQYPSIGIADIDFYMQEIQRGSFFISNWDNTLGFVHQSFMEYFIGEYIANILSEHRSTDSEYYSALNMTFFSPEIGKFILDVVKNIPNSSFEAFIAKMRRFLETKQSTLTRYNAFLILALANDDISNIIVKWTDYCNYKLNNAIIHDCIISHTLFSGTVFAHATLSNVHFVNCQFVDVDFSDTVITSCDFGGRNLSSSRWQRSTVLDTCFDDSSLTEANFGGATVEKCTFRRADLSGLQTDNSSFLHNTYEETIGQPYDIS